MLNIKKIELEPIPVPGHGMCKFYPTNRFEPISPKDLMSPGYQLKNEDLYNISISNAKKFVPDFSDKENT